MTSTLSFQGVTTGLQTDSLVSAIIASDSQALDRLKASQTKNTQRSAALASLRTSLTSLTTSISSFYDKLSAQTVTSTDADNTYVTATASGAAAGNYEVKVTQVATRGQLGPTTSGTGTNLTVADPNAAIVTGTGSFAVEGTDGVVKSFQLTNNSLNGLRDAINASGAGVTASVVNTGIGSNPYQLVITATDEGTGSTGGVVKLAAINNSDGSSTTVNAGLGITTGTVTTDSNGVATLTGGLSSSGSGIATDALFSVNGIAMSRSSNTVTDAVDGITFTLKKGDSSNSTTLNVATDTATATTAMQDVLAKFNAVLKVYTDNNTTTQDADTGDVTSGVFVGDSVARSVINQIRDAISGGVSGASSSALYKSGSSIGIKTGSDGTLSLDTTVFADALKTDQNAVAKVFTFSGTSTVGSVKFSSATSDTGTGDVGFNLTYGTGGAITGSLTYGGTTYSSANGDFTGSGGTLKVTAGALKGLTLSLTASGTGTLTLSRGIGQKLQDTIASLTSYSGSIQTTRASIDAQNQSLSFRIEDQQAILDKRQAALKEKFDAMEYTVAQLRAVSSSLGSS